MAYVREFKEADIEHLAANLRPSDLQEVQAASGMSPEVALGYGLGQKSFVIINNENPVAVYGVTPSATPQFGAVWMLATTEFHQVGRQFLRECRAGVDDLCREFEMVFNYSDARNKVHHRWLKWCGFNFIRTVNYGVEDRPFIEFAKIIRR